jgi:hypothetical protein
MDLVMLAGKDAVQRNNQKSLQDSDIQCILLGCLFLLFWFIKNF